MTGLRSAPDPQQVISRRDYDVTFWRILAAEWTILERAIIWLSCIASSIGGVAFVAMGYKGSMDYSAAYSVADQEFQAPSSLSGFTLVISGIFGSAATSAMLLAVFRAWCTWILLRRLLKQSMPGVGVDGSLSDRVVIGITTAALFIAGVRRAYLREAWISDLYDESGVKLESPRRLRHAGGYIVAAIKLRAINDFGRVAGSALDKILTSPRRTDSALCILMSIPVSLIFVRQGLYGLVTNAEQLAAIAAALLALTHAARKWRGVQVSKKRAPDDDVST